MRNVLLALLATAALAGGCTKLPETPPTQPDPIRPAPVVTTPPVSEAPESGVTPAPTLGTPPAAPEPGASPEPGPEPPAGTAPPPSSSGCGPPHPADGLARIKIAIHLRGSAFWTLDATPLVGPDAAYCAEIGFTDGREMCPVRPEGHPERVACETWLVGAAVDTARSGPTWRRDGSLCTSASGCENDPENQYLLRAIASGAYTACARSGVCGEQIVDR